MSENKGLSDLEIAHNATILPIEEIARRAEEAKAKAAAALANQPAR